MTYEFFCLDRDGDCTDVRELRAVHDADAIYQVEFMGMQFVCELWQRSRFVAMIPAVVVDLA